MKRSPLPPLYRLLGERLAQLRRSRIPGGLTQHQLAKRVGLTRASITNIEAGRQRLSLETIWALADAFGIEPRLLIPERREFDIWLRQSPGSSDQTTEIALQKDLELLGLRGSRVEEWLRDRGLQLTKAADGHGKQTRR